MPLVVSTCDTLSTRARGVAAITDATLRTSTWRDCAQFPDPMRAMAGPVNDVGGGEVGRVGRQVHAREVQEALVLRARGWSAHHLAHTRGHMHQARASSLVLLPSFQATSVLVIGGDHHVAWCVGGWQVHECGVASSHAQALERVLRLSCG